MALVAPPLAPTVSRMVNFAVLPQPVKSIDTSPVTLAEGARLPSDTGKLVPITGVHAVPPVCVSVSPVIAALVAAPIPVS